MVIVASSQEGAFAPTQPRQSQSQHASQPDESSHQDIWGVLVPFSHKVETISFQRWKHRYYIGRQTEEHETDKYKNDVLLYGLTVSGFHCVIEWDGDESENTTVTVKDFSSNGTYINGGRIPKNILTVLNNGDEIAFGQCAPHTGEHEHMDYRYIYRHRAYSPPTHGLYKSYNMRRELGRGTFATVVKALHRAEGQFYAVKIIEASMLRGDWSRAILGHAPERLDEISREIAILQRLEHRNICALKEFFLEGYTLSLVLELVPGGDLLHYLLKNHREDRMSERMARYFTYQMCDALAYVHNLGIAHRDLKPENVLLTSDSPPVVKIADFGLAKAVDEKTMLRTVCGTPVYLAPEVVTRGSEGYGLLVDCWSVGVIVFSMMTMLVPFLDDSSTDVHTRIANRVVQWDILRACGISLEGEDFLRGLLENDPRQRLAMADACIHPWLAEQAVRVADVQQLDAPFSTPTNHPRSPRPVVSDGMSVYDSDEHLSAPSVGPEPTPCPDERSTPDLSSIPGLQLHSAVSQTELPGTPGTSSPQTRPREDYVPDTGGDPAPPHRANKRKAALASSSSFGSLERASSDSGRSMSRADLFASRDPRAKRARVDPSSD